MKNVAADLITFSPLSIRHVPAENSPLPPSPAKPKERKLPSPGLSSSAKPHALFIGSFSLRSNASQLNTRHLCRCFLNFSHSPSLLILSELFTADAIRP
jgi:hypothetical protein